jgi:hypothetical protein
VGIYHAGNMWKHGEAILPLADVQECERKDGLLTLIYVKARPGADLDQLTARMEEDHAGLVAPLTVLR